MNHDATHCRDWDENCPKTCYRAELTEELSRRPDLFWLPMSWASFRYSEECAFRTLPKPKNDGKVRRILG